jgi:hypothetical protein
VISLLDDDRSIERRDMTREFWARRDEFLLSTSEVTMQEINLTSDLQRRQSMIASLSAVNVLPLTPEQ